MYPPPKDFFRPTSVSSGPIVSNTSSVTLSESTHPPVLAPNTNADQCQPLLTDADISSPTMFNKPSPHYLNSIHKNHLWDTPSTADPTPATTVELINHTISSFKQPDTSIHTPNLFHPNFPLSWNNPLGDFPLPHFEPHTDLEVPCVTQRPRYMPKEPFKKSLNQKNHLYYDPLIILDDSYSFPSQLSLHSKFAGVELSLPEVHGSITSENTLPSKRSSGGDWGELSLPKVSEERREEIVGKR
ncbi:hypothetical protein GEMRC1_001272 [Eukaryota sp. GEM-RC1]